ncbi:MAG TPA: cytochrome c peroxidase [Terriglobia bacterium]|nr:cytochrome c peroxidase [Terriglobia bacterium]
MMTIFAVSATLPAPAGAEATAAQNPPQIGESAPTTTTDAGAAGRPAALSREQAYAQAKALTAIGARLFRDPHLSGSGQLACSSCHDPDNAFAQSNNRAVQLGGGDLHESGLRAVPSLKYLQAVPQFSEHFFDSEDEADESVDNGPTGGLTWDGRADSKMDQARIPLLSSFEMGNRSPDDVVDAAGKGGYLAELAKILGPAATKDKTAAFDAVLLAVQVYQQDPASFYPYDSKYDAYLAGKATLTPQEQRGLVAFSDENKGNCASCHIAERALDGSAPQFTDYGLIAIGLPRNPAIPANRDPGYVDLGLCGPQRTDFKNHADYCGLFRTPTLRNVATRHVFFHNGFIHNLRDAVAFYATRDSDPGRWYPKRADGSIDKFNDLPMRYRGNLNTDPPFDDKPGHPQRLTDAEIDDIVAFLKTLTDGYRP